MRRHLDFETCIKSARSFGTRHEFLATDKSAYQWFVKNGRLSDLDDIWPIESSAAHPGIRKRRFPRNHAYSFEECSELVSECRSREAFRDIYSAAFIQARSNGWLPRLPFVDGATLRKEKWKYTVEDIVEHAALYDSPSQFMKADRSRYSFAQSHGLLKSLKWRHLDTEVLANRFTDTVYAYEFPGWKTVYVGRSVHPNKRHRQHLLSDDAVARFAREHHVHIPPMTILYSGISPTDGARRETFSLQMYLDLGWKPLNSVKPGSLGTLNYGKLSEKYCMDVASRFGTLIDLINDEPCVYDKLRRSGKLDACTWLKRAHRPCPDGSWGTCPKETVRKEAGKYGSLQEFRQANQAAYIRCRKEGWTWEFFKKPVPWNRRPISDIVAEAHRYGTVAEFRRHSPRAHAIARSAGLLASLFPAVPRRPNPLCRTVVQMDMEGNDIATFRSINEAARALGLTRDNGAICHACHGITDSAYGYRFRFG